MGRFASPAPDCGHCPWLANEAYLCPTRRRSRLWYWSLDLGFGATLGVLVVWMHDKVTAHGMPPVWFLASSMILIMAAQSMLSFLIGAVTGAMEAMIPGGFVAMTAMAGAYLPIADPVPRLLSAAAIGLVTTSCFVLWDAMFRRPHERSCMRRIRSRAFRPRFTIPTPARIYDLLESAGVRRRACVQRRLFARMEGTVLFVAAGTGLNFAHFPPRRRIVAIDVSAAMLERAIGRASRYDGNITLLRSDVQMLPFPDGAFDTVATASTFCSVPDPDRGLSELYRILKPGGRVLMFEHVRSRNPVVALAQDMMNMMVRYLGPEVNRDTVASVRAAGFVIDRIGSAYLDVFVAIEGHKPARHFRTGPAL